MNRAHDRKARLALGVAVICLFFLLETWNADRFSPHPASPFIWAALGTVAVVAIGLALWFRHLSRRS